MTNRLASFPLLALSLGLAATASGQECFFGLSHEPLGQAQLASGPDGRLRVSNLGSSGKDGVSIDAGDGQGIEVTFDLGATGVLPIESRLQIKTYFETGDIPTQQQFSTLIDSQTDGTVGVGFETMGWTPSCINVRVMLGGAVVDHAQLVAPYPQYLAVGNIGSSGKDGVSYRASLGSGGSPRMETELRLPGPDTLTIDGRGPVQGDALFIDFEGLPPGEPVRGLFEVTAMDPPGGLLHLHAENVVHRDIAARAVGQGKMDGVGSARRGQLVVSNIGSSGKDGVSIDLGGFGGTDLMRLELDPAPIPPGQLLMLTGMLGGSPAGFIGLEALPGQMLLFADFLPSGGQSLILEVYDAGVFVGCAPVQSGGPVGDVSDGPVGPVELRTLEFITLPIDGVCGSSGGARTLGLGFGFNGPALIQPFGQPPLVGDTVRLIHPTLPPPGNLPAECLITTTVPQLVLDDILRTSPFDPIVSGGLPHQPLGTAQLDTSGGTLTVSNIGSSGKDGVSIDLGGTQGWSAELDFGPAGNLDPNLDLTLGVRTFDGDDTDVPPLILTGQPGGSGQLSLPAGTDVGAVTVTVRAGGAVVHTQTDPPPTSNLVVGNIGSSGKDGVRCTSFLDENNESDWEFVRRLELPGGGPVTVGPYTGPADSIDVRHATTGDPILRVDVNIATTPGGTLVIGDEALVEFNALARTLGGGTGSGLGCLLTEGLIVDNLGSSGKDGVSLADNLGSSGKDGVSAVGFATDIVPTGGSVNVERFHIRQEFGPQQQQQRISSVDLDGLGGGAGRELFLDTLPWLPQPQVTLELELGGAVVWSGPMPPPPVVLATQVVPTLPGQYEFEFITNGEGMAIGVEHRFQWEAPLDLTVRGGVSITVSADSARIRAESAMPFPAGGVVPELESIVVLCAADGTGLELTETTFIFPDSCPADLDGSGDVGFNDLLTVLAAWGPCAGCPGDLDGDDAIGFADLLIVLASWGTCD